MVKREFFTMKCGISAKCLTKPLTQISIKNIINQVTNITTVINGFLQVVCQVFDEILDLGNH